MHVTQQHCQCAFGGVAAVVCVVTLGLVIAAPSVQQCDGKKVNPALRFGLTGDYDLAERICCHNTMWAEPSGFASQHGLYARLSRDGDGATVFYDSVCGAPLFKAPVGRSFAAWKAESERHGWPSFRPEESFPENIVIHSGGEMASICGTHLGHNLPDGKGDRYCIDLVCVAGQPTPANATFSSGGSPAGGAGGLQTGDCLLYGALVLAALGLAGWGVQVHCVDAAHGPAKSTLLQ